MILSDLALFVNSSFITSLVGAFAGAFAGAYAAQRVAERARIREELTREIRHVNAALGLAVGIANSALATKRQHVLPLKLDYDAQVKRYSDWKAAQASTASTQPAIYDIGLMDFKTFPMISAPISALQDFVYTRINVIGRPINLVVTLSESLQNLATAISHRNELINSFKNESLPYGASRETMYLGLPYGQGKTNQEYPDTVAAISSYTDCVIFFSILLTTDLRNYGLKVTKQFSISLGSSAPRVALADFAASRELGLIPSDDEFCDWLKSFKVEDGPLSPT